MSDLVQLGTFVDKGEIQLQTGPFGTQLKAKDYVEVGIPVINVRNIGMGSIVEQTLEYISEETRDRLSSHVLLYQDIVFGRKGAVERHAYIRQEYDGWFQGSDCIRMRVKTEQLIPQYVSYCLLTPQHQKWMQNHCSHGATMASLNQDIIKLIPIEVCDISIQEKIVYVLSVYDELIENNNRRIAILEEMAQRLYREWFVHFRFPGHENVEMVDSEFGMIPEGWGIRTPKELAVHYIGGGWGKENSSTTLQPAFVIRGTDIPDARRNNISNCPLRFHTESNLKDRCLLNGDIVIEVSGGSKGQPVGRPLLITEELLNSFNGQRTICASFCKLYRCNLEEISPYYLYLWLLEIYRNGEIERYQSQSTGIINFKYEYFLDSPIVLVPDFEVRKAFDKQIKMIFRQINLLGRKNVTLRKTRDHLLPCLISGDINVSEIDIPVEDVSQ